MQIIKSRMLVLVCAHSGNWAFRFTELKWRIALDVIFKIVFSVTPA